MEELVTDKLDKEIADQILEGFRHQDEFPHPAKQDAAPATRSGWAWKDLPQEVKQRFPSPPERSNFSSDELYEEARGFWHGRIGRNIGMVMLQYENQKK